jgi:hypothetical protein
MHACFCSTFPEFPSGRCISCKRQKIGTAPGLAADIWGGSRVGSRLLGRLPAWLPTSGLAPGLAPDFRVGSRLGSRLLGRLPAWLPTSRLAPGLAPDFRVGSRLGSRLLGRLPVWLPTLGPTPGFSWMIFSFAVLLVDFYGPRCYSKHSVDHLFDYGPRC